MHHMPDFEDFMKSENDSIKSKQLNILLQFLRPIYERQYLTARKRSVSEQPTVRFEDLWALMKPGLLAYTKWEGEWLGCIIGECSKSYPVSSDQIEQFWDVEYFILQVHWPSDEIRFARGTLKIDQYNGEQLITSLPICPAEVYDATDMGVRRRELTERGQKTCQLIWESPRYVYHQGRSLNKDKRYVSLTLELSTS